MGDLIKREDALKAFETEVNGVRLDFAILVVDRFLQERDCDLVWDAVRCLRDCVEGSKWNIEHLPSVQPECEHTMEEFMCGQDMGNPEDGSL